MAIEAITCPNCGAAGINIDTAREYSFCSYCGTTIRTKDVLHLDVESTTIEKLKRNALRSFEVGQYDNAWADWSQAAQLDRTDYESYWGLVRCHMNQRPKDIIDKALYEKTLAYAPPGVKEEYSRQMDAHNDRIRAVWKKKETFLIRWRAVLLIAAIIFVMMSCLMLMFDSFEFDSFEVDTAVRVFWWTLLLAVAAFLAFRHVQKKLHNFRQRGRNILLR